jgi:hypothetical protein
MTTPGPGPPVLANLARRHDGVATLFVGCGDVDSRFESKAANHNSFFSGGGGSLCGSCDSIASGVGKQLLLPQLHSSP